MRGVLGIGHTKSADNSSLLSWVAALRPIGPCVSNLSSHGSRQNHLAVGTAIAVMLGMMTLPSLRPFRSMSAFWAAAFLASQLAAQPAPGSAAGQNSRIHVSEIGLLRTLVLVDENSTDMHQRLVSELLKRDFFVHEAPQYAASTITTQEMTAAGEAAQADLVIFASVKDQEIDNYGGGVRYSAEASVKIVNRVTGRTVAWNDPEEIRGARSNKPDRARKDARTKAILHGVTGAVEQVLASSYKMVVHTAVITDVFTEADLLRKMEDIARLPEIYHVRRLEFNRETNEAKVEIIGAPRSATFWRAHIEQHMSKTELSGVDPNSSLGKHIPNWFFQPPKQ
jgi:hypothetical protein